ARAGDLRRRPSLQREGDAAVAALQGRVAARRLELGQQLKRRADARAGDPVVHEREIDRRARALRRRLQRLELGRPDDSVLRRADALLIGDDGIAGALAEGAVDRAVVEVEPAESV